MPLVLPDTAIREPSLIVPGRHPTGNVRIRPDILGKISYIVPMFGGNWPNQTQGNRKPVSVIYPSSNFTERENGLYSGAVTDAGYYDSTINGRSNGWISFGFVCKNYDTGTSNRFFTMQGGSSELNCLDNGTAWTMAAETITTGIRASAITGKILAGVVLRRGTSSTGPTFVAMNLGGTIVTQYNAAGCFWSTAWAYDRITIGNDASYNDAAKAVHYYAFSDYNRRILQSEAEAIAWAADPFAWVEAT